MNAKITPSNIVEIELDGKPAGEFRFISEWEGMRLYRNVKGETVMVDCKPQVSIGGIFESIFGSDGSTNGMVIKISDTLMPKEDRQTVRTRNKTVAEYKSGDMGIVVDKNLPHIRSGTVCQLLTPREDGWVVALTETHKVLSDTFWLHSNAFVVRVDTTEQEKQ